VGLLSCSLGRHAGAGGAVAVAAKIMVRVRCADITAAWHYVKCGNDAE